MKFDETSLKRLANEDAPRINDDKALEKVLSQSSKLTSTKDVASLFVAWIWVLFLGFGGAIYSAKRRYELHQQQRKNIAAILPENKDNSGEKQ